MRKFILEMELQNEWENLMQEGYTYSMAGDSVAAATVWRELWDKMSTVLESDGSLSMEDLDGAFHATQSIYNWMTDYEMELGNASRENKSFAVPVKSVKISRNDPCTCGSGIKYKKCCGK